MFKKKNLLFVFILFFSLPLISAVPLSTAADSYSCTSVPDAITDCALGGDISFHTSTDVAADLLTNMVYQYSYTFPEGFGLGIIVNGIFSPSDGASDIPAYLQCLDALGNPVILNSTIVNKGTQNYVLNAKIPELCQLPKNELILRLYWDPIDHPDSISFRDFFFSENGGGIFLTPFGGDYETPSGSVNLIVPEGALLINEFITVSETTSTSNTDTSSLSLQKEGAVTATSPIYALGPDIDFYVPINVSFKYNEFDVIENSTTVYFYDEISKSWDNQSSVCDIDKNECSFTTTHFSDFIIGALNKDTDGDGIFDINDECPSENATGLDANRNGCKDTIKELINVTLSMGLDNSIENSLISKLKKADNSKNKKDALKQINAFKNEVKAKIGKGITEDQAEVLLGMADNIIYQL